MYDYERFKYFLALCCCMNEESIFLKYVGDNPRMRILEYFIYTLTDLLKAGVSWGTLNQLVPQILELDVIIKTRKIGRATLYKINKENPVAKQLMTLYDGLILQKLKEIERAYAPEERKNKLLAPLTHSR